MNGAFGLAAGLALGIGLALVRDRMSGRLRSSDEVEEYLEAPVLGVVPQVSEWRRGKRAYLVSSRALAIARRGSVPRHPYQPALGVADRSQEHRRDQHAQRRGQVGDCREPGGRPRRGRQERDARVRRPAATAPPRVLPARRDSRAQRRPRPAASLGCRHSGGHAPVISPDGSVGRLAAAGLERTRARRSGGAPGIRSHERRSSRIWSASRTSC